MVLGYAKLSHWVALFCQPIHRNGPTAGSSGKVTKPPWAKRSAVLALSRRNRERSFAPGSDKLMTF